MRIFKVLLLGTFMFLMTTPLTGCSSWAAQKIGYSYYVTPEQDEFPKTGHSRRVVVSKGGVSDGQSDFTDKPLPNSTFDMCHKSTPQINIEPRTDESILNSNGPKNTKYEIKRIDGKIIITIIE